MNLGVSLKLALAKRSIKNKDFAITMGVSEQAVSNWINKNCIKASSIESIASALDMKASEFVALGE